MTPEEWIERCAKRYRERADIDEKKAVELAQACFEAQEGEFCPSADYNPEACADEDMSYWLDS